MPDPSRRTLHKLAQLHGIQTAFYDVTGRRRQASREVLVGLLNALGVPLEGSHDVADAVRAEQETRWHQLVEPVTVAWNGTLPCLDLRIPERLLDNLIHIRLQLETGEEKTWSIKPGDARTTGKERVEGIPYVVKRALLRGKRRDPLPLGYHDATIEVGNRSRQTLIVASPHTACLPATGKTGKPWGVFLPLYALHGEQGWGAGDFGDLRHLTEWVTRLGGGVVATLPLLAAFLHHHHDASPYAPASRLFWNEFYIDLNAIPELGRSEGARALLDSREMTVAREGLRSASLVDYRKQMALKRQVLEQIARTTPTWPSARREAFERFTAEQPAVEDYARFRAAGEHLETQWQEWPQRLREGQIRPGDYRDANLAYHLCAQWIASEQLQALSEQASRSGEGLYLDLPLGVHPSGYDVWRERSSFVAGARGGAPPDTVFTKGQDWGFAPLHPEGLRDQHYRYFIACLRHHMRQARVLRIDHVMGLHRLYMIPSGFDAPHGAYVRYRAEELYAFLTLESHRHGTWLVGENLGTVPGHVNAALARHGIHSTYVVQYELSARSKQVLRPAPLRAVASLNTHDMPTFSGFWKGLDLEDRRDLGLLGAADVEVERKGRQALRRSLVRFLRAKGLFGRTDPDQYEFLGGCLTYLGASRAALILVNLEDLWLETKPQNVPSSQHLRPNWMRKARYSLEAMQRLPEVLKPLQMVNQLRHHPPTRRKRPSRDK